MKVMKMSEENVVIFLPISNLSIDFSSKEVLEDYFQKLFPKLEKQYDLYLTNFFRIEVYQEPQCGVILDIEMEEIPYFDYFEHQVEMSIQVVKDAFFLYQIEDILDLDVEILKNSNIYQYKNKYYLKIKKEIGHVYYMKLLEYSDIIYGKEAKKIIKHGKHIHYIIC